MAAQRADYAATHYNPAGHGGYWSSGRHRSRSECSEPAHALPAGRFDRTTECPITLTEYESSYRCVVSAVLVGTPRGPWTSGLCATVEVNRIEVLDPSRLTFIALMPSWTVWQSKLLSPFGLSIGSLGVGVHSASSLSGGSTIELDSRLAASSRMNWKRRCNPEVHSPRGSRFTRRRA